MEESQQERTDTIRRKSNEIQNHIIDEYSHGKITRREFIRRGAIAGLSLPFLGFLATACGDDDAQSTTTTVAGTAGTSPTTTTAEPVTVRVGVDATSVGVEPVLINDEAGLALLGQTGEYLVFSDAELNAEKALATDWSSNDTGDVWTFAIREGATFNDGSPLTAQDVAATFNGPISGGNAASAYGTFGFEAGAAVALDDHTVQFTLNAPNGAFPFFVSSDNYNATILPASFWDAYSEGSYEQSFIGTGPWIEDSYERDVSAVYVKNPNYWGDNSAQPDRMEVTFFADDAAAITAFQEGRIDMIHSVSFAAAAGLVGDPEAKIQNISTAQHRQVYFDTASPPFDDKRVRQAMALVLNRPTLIEGLLSGFGVLGNDHPIWQFYPMYDPGAVEQRTQDVAQARALLADAGFPNGFDAPLDTLAFNEIEDLAQLIQASALEAGVNLDVNVTDSGTYYSDFWLAAQGSMGIVNYGHRGVPNVYLGAPLLGDDRGTWNASHWVNPAYDALYDQFVSAPDLDTQRQLAGQIEVMLNDEVPFAVPYFLDFVSIVRPDLVGLETTGMGHFKLIEAGFNG